MCLCWPVGVCVCVLVLLQRKRNEKTKGKGNAKEGINRRFHPSGSFLKFKVGWKWVNTHKKMKVFS